MANVGDFIRAADYNTIQSKLAGILGVGSGASGYGQNITSAQVGVGDAIRASQWSALRNDLLRARQHQTGLDESSNLTAISAGQTVAAASIEVQYNTFADTVVTNRLAFATNQISVDENLTSTTRTTAWNGTIQCVVTITFNGYTQGSTTVSGADHMRCFFNAGGSFTATSSRSGGTASAKNTAWTNMLSDSNTVTFGYSATTSNGNGTNYAVGWSNLTTTNQKIFFKPAPSGSYSENQYNIYARLQGTNQIILTVEYADLDSGGDNTGPQNGPPPFGPGVDENPDGTLTCLIKLNRPSGSNVTIPAPAATAPSIA